MNVIVEGEVDIEERYLHHQEGRVVKLDAKAGVVLNVKVADEKEMGEGRNTRQWEWNWGLDNRTRFQCPDWAKAH